LINCTTRSTVALAKFILAEGDAHGIGEAEFVELVNAHAAAKGTTFAKLFSGSTEESVILRKAHQRIQHEGGGSLNRRRRRGRAPMTSWSPRLTSWARNTSKELRHRRSHCARQRSSCCSPASVWARFSIGRPHSPVALSSFGDTGTNEQKLTKAQAFERVYTDEANRELVARERAERFQ
jgi:hypothetical protein